MKLPGQYDVMAYCDLRQQGLVIITMLLQIIMYKKTGVNCSYVAIACACCCGDASLIFKEKTWWAVDSSVFSKYWITKLYSSFWVHETLL